MFSSLLVLQNPTCTVIPAEAMNNSDSSWGGDEYKLTNSEEECVKKHDTLCATSNNPCDLPIPGGGRFYIPTLIKSPEV